MINEKSAIKLLTTETPAVEVGNKNMSGECGMCGIKAKKLYPQKIGSVEFMICGNCKSIMDM